jgi:hypothetical protein
MDNLFRIPGVNWRFGLDPILGLVPGVGDLISTALSVYILLAAVQYGVPKITLLRMGLNIGLDLLIGAIPFVGDFFDFVWKANERNVELLRNRSRAYGTVAPRTQLSDWLFVAVVIAVVVGILISAAAITVFFIGQIAALFAR